MDVQLGLFMVLTMHIQLHERVQKVLSEGSNSDGFCFDLLFVRGERIQIALKKGHHRLSAKRHLNGVSLAGR